MYNIACIVKSRLVKRTKSLGKLHERASRIIVVVLVQTVCYSRRHYAECLNTQILRCSVVLS